MQVLSFFGIKDKEDADVETSTQHSDYEDEAIANFFLGDDDDEGSGGESTTTSTVAADDTADDDAETATERSAKTVSAARRRPPLFDRRLQLDDGPPLPSTQSSSSSLSPAVQDDAAVTPRADVDALAALADTLETTARGAGDSESGGSDDDKPRRPARGRVQQLERIINAVQAMLETEGVSLRLNTGGDNDDEGRRALGVARQLFASMPLRPLRPQSPSAVQQRKRRPFSVVESAESDEHRFSHAAARSRMFAPMRSRSDDDDVDDDDDEQRRSVGAHVPPPDIVPAAAAPKLGIVRTMFNAMRGFYDTLNDVDPAAEFFRRR